MSNPAPTLNQINAFNATQGTTIDFNIIGGTEVIRSNKIYIYDLSDNSLICTHLYVSTESIHEFPPNTSSSIVYASGKSSADFTNNTQYYAQIQTFTDTSGTQGASGLSVAKLFWCLPTPTLTLGTIPTTISTTSYNVSATYTPNTSGGATNEIQEFQFNLYSAIGALLQTSGVVLYGEGVDLSYNFSGLEVDSTYYVTLDVTTTQGMNVSAQSNTFTVSIDTPTMGSASVVNNGCDGYISVTSNLSSEYEHEESAGAGEIMSFATDSVNDITELDVDFSPVQDGTPWMSAQDTEPYMFRAVPTQTEDFGHESDTIVGGTVGWNQFMDLNDWSTQAVGGVTFINNGDGSYTINGTATGNTFVTENKPFINGHIYFLSGCPKNGARSTYFLDTGANIGGSDVGNGFVGRCNFSTGNYYVRMYVMEGTTVNNLKVVPQLIDLTAMFGSTIADYVYSLEQATAGAGVAWFRKLFPKPYYEYNAGELMSVNTSAHNTVGFNAFDEELELGGCNQSGNYADENKVRSKNYIPVIDGQTYYVKSSKLLVFYGFDSNKSGLVGCFNGYTTVTRQNQALTIPYGVKYLRFYYSDNTIVANDICINLSWDGERDGEYEEYVKHSYPLDSDLTLRGIPKLDASNNLYYDGDVYESDGTVTRRYGIVTFDGSNDEKWGKLGSGSASAYAMRIKIDGKIIQTSNRITILCDKLEPISPSATWGNYPRFIAPVLNDDTIAAGISTITTVEDWRTYLASNPITVVYELATPTDFTADPYTNPQIVDPHGTEQYVGSPIPVGHETTYQRICPISGWDGVEVDVVGKNLFDPSSISEWSSVSGMNLTKNDDGSFTMSGTATATNYQSVTIPLKAGTYTFTGCPSGGSQNTYSVYIDGTGVSAYDTGNGATFTLTSAQNIRFVIPRILVGTNVNGLTFKPQLELGSTPTPYQPYQGTTYTSIFPKYKQQVTQDKIPYITKDIGDTYADTLTENLVGGTIAWNQSVPDTTTTHTISGSIASMDDAVAGNFESVVCDIEPVQDLHGYDKPWVGGAGANKIAPKNVSRTINGVSVVASASSETITVNGTATDNGGRTNKLTDDFTLPAGTYYFMAFGKVSAGVALNNASDSVVKWANNSFTLTEETSVYVGVNVTSGTTYNETIRLSIVSSSTAPTAWTPWENLCPITGWTGCEVVTNGVNFLALPIYYRATTAVPQLFKIKKGDYYIRCNVKNATSWRLGVWMKDKNGNNLSDSGHCPSSSIFSWYANPGYWLFGANSTTNECTIHIEEDCNIRFFIGLGDTTEQTEVVDAQLERGSIATTYTPYNGTTYPVSWQTEAGTVYGGTVDLVTGVLTVDRKFVNIDPSTVSINAIVAGGGRYVVTTTDAKDVQTSDPIAYTICNTLKSITSDSIEIGGSSLISSKRLSFMLPVSTQAEARQWFTDNTTTVVYPLATPQTYQLDPVQVACLLGQNNVWNNISDTTVTYPTNHSYQSLSTTHKYYKRINGVESISVGSDVVADVGTDNIIDLTQMFGTTIADYIYNIEQSSSSGMGVKFFKSLFPNDDYDYNSGELISVNASAHVIKDANGNVLHTYPLDSDLVLRGIPKLDANNKLYYDGDVYEPSGSVTRKYGIVDMGTLNWTTTTVAGHTIFWENVPNGKMANTNYNGICSKYPLYNDDTYSVDKSLRLYGNSSYQFSRAYIRDDSYTDATSFKTAMSGVYLVYELNTTTTTQADPFEENQSIVSNGIEEYTVTEQGDVEMPVGHDSTYYATEVYGGTIDMAKGVLTINMASVDLGSLNWVIGGLPSSQSGVRKRMRTMALETLAKHAASNNTQGNIICSIYSAISYNGGYADVDILNRIAIDTDGDVSVFVAYNDYETVADFKSAMNGVQLVYELATPIEISLTPQQMQTLSGQNNIWSNTNGGMYLIYQLPITSLLVKRRDVADVSGKWLTLYSTPITQASDMDFTFIDFLNQYGKTYQYALVPVLAQDQSGVIVQIEGGYTVSDNVDSIFDGVYIADQTNVERVKAGVGYGNIDMNQGVGSITPIGSKYPIVITNSQNQYHNGSIRGTIVPNDFYSNGNLSRIDMVNKRDELEQFLTNKRAKIIKDWNGKMWLVMIMSNVACSFDDNYGMGMVSFSADWLEVGDPTNQQDLYNAGLINVGGV